MVCDNCHERDAVVNLQDATMKVNRQNINAMRLLSQNRGFEAMDLLKKTLPLDPNNTFTLNNLGVASESIGDFNGTTLPRLQLTLPSRRLSPQIARGAESLSAIWRLQAQRDCKSEFGIRVLLNRKPSW